ncbi:hypothetical protein B0A48_14175 [Cryoendolithus antarcticus]|uniref:ACB domain-containing protein n=1 Tax=Cryoendolithus antarcticus TaxID=1507870 RepID=A0A1V8SLY8_9PEZI|nr:hypothetical protein B0A48_14175 [Cryoendolithus antarcticus]
MADSVDRVFGHALTTVTKIRPGAQKPPPSARLALYGLYKQSMEGDVHDVHPRPTSSDHPDASPEHLRREQEKWDAWAANATLSRTEAKRRYIETLISTMRQYASHTDEARQLVEELEFVWDQIKSNSFHGSGSEQSSPGRDVERSGYLGVSSEGGGNGITSSTAAMERPLTVLSPVSQADEEEEVEEAEEEEFVDAPAFSQVDAADLRETSEGSADDPQAKAGRAVQPRSTGNAVTDVRWRKRIESSLFKLSTEIAALREQLEANRWIKTQRRKSVIGWITRIGWWALQLFVADGVILWIVLLYMRRKQDRRLEGAIRVLLGDAVAQVQKVASDVKIPKLPQISARKKDG